MDEIEGLIGVSAGKICFSNIDPEGFYIKQLLKEAEVIWESGRSGWTLLSQDINGLTRWLSPDEGEVATVGGYGEILIEVIGMVE